MISARRLKHLVDWLWKNRTYILIHSVGDLRHHWYTKQCLHGSCQWRRLKLNYWLIMMRRTGCLRSFKRKDFITGEYVCTYVCTESACMCMCVWFSLVCFVYVFLMSKPVFQLWLLDSLYLTHACFWVNNFFYFTFFFHILILIIFHFSCLFSINISYFYF